MTSEVGIANIALGHLGDAATVVSFDPPEGSAQAEHCALFYPIARDSLLEMHPWGFATRRAVLAEVASTATEWDRCYAQPINCIKAIAVLPPDALDDYSQTPNAATFGASYAPFIGAAYTPRDFSQETNDVGEVVIYTDQINAVLRYVARITDTAKFSNTFTMGLSWMLASLLAGPVWKGDAGAAEAKRCLGMVDYWINKAMSQDSNQRQATTQQSVPWVGGR